MAGVLAGALIGAIRNLRDPSSVFFFPTLQSAAISIAVSLVIAIFQMLLCQPGHKSGWNVPLWSIGIQGVAIFVAGVVGSFLRQSPTRTAPRLSSIIVSALLGAIVGAVAFLGVAFDGYFVLQSNSRPIIQAITGFVIGGGVALLWCAVNEISPSSESRGSMCTCGPTKG